MAKEAALKDGIKVEDYVLLSTQFDARKGSWMLSYTHKPPGYPGGHFAVEINDETRQTRLWRGR